MGVNLLELALGLGADGAGVIVGNGAGAGRSLIERKDPDVELWNYEARNALGRGALTKNSHPDANPPPSRSRLGFSTS